MRRRDFFKNLLGGAAAITIGPKVMAQIEEYDYVKDIDHEALTGLADDDSPQYFFPGKEGLWVFHKGEIVAWSGLHGLVLHMDRELIDISRDPRYATAENPVPLYKEYIGGPSSSWYTVEHLHIRDYGIFEEDILLKILYVTNDSQRIECEGIWTEYSTLPRPEEGVKAKFLMVGNTTITNI